MKAITKALTLQVFTLLILVGCGGKDSQSVVDNQGQLIIDSSLVSINLHTSQQYSATFIDKDGNRSDVSEKVQWSSSDSSLVSITGAGKALALQEGMVRISASIDGLRTFSDLSVTNKTISSITVTPAQTITLVGLDKRFQAQAIFSDGSHQDITNVANWSSLDAAIATMDGNNASGVSSGTSGISAEFSAVQGKAELAVSAADISHLKVEPHSSQIASGSSVALQGLLLLTNGDAIDITEQLNWVSGSAETVFVSNSQGSKGLALGVNPGNAPVYASLTVDGHQVSGTADVTVNSAAIIRLEIFPSSSQMAKGTQLPFTAVAYYSDNSHQDVSAQALWSSNNIHIISIHPTGPNAGLAQAIDTGSTMIQANFDGLMNESEIEVTAASVTSLQISQDQLTIPVGTTGRYQATAYFSDNTSLDISRDASWVSDQPEVIQVITEGTQAGDGIALNQGSATITVSYMGLDTSTDTHVSDATITELIISPASSTLAKGTRKLYQATAIYSDSSSIDITEQAIWTVTDSRIAEVLNDLEHSGLVTALSEGSTVLNAHFSGLVASSNIKVTEATLDKILLTPGRSSVPEGTTGRFIATAIFSDNSSQDVSRDSSWISGDSEIVQVITLGSSAGDAQALAMGTTSVTANYRGLSASSHISVHAAAIRQLSIIPRTVSVAVGTEGRYQAIAEYTDGSKADVSKEAHWHSSDTEVVTITKEGDDAAYAQAIMPGTSTIMVSFDGLTDESQATVTEAIALELHVSPEDLSAPIGTLGTYTATALFSDGSRQDVTRQASWSSSNNDFSDSQVVHIVTSGKNAGDAQALNIGSSTIKAEFSGLNYQVHSRVTDAEVVGLQVTPGNALIAQGTEQTYTAIAYFSDNSHKDVSLAATWRSGAENIVSIGKQAQGIVAQGLNSGETTIRADYGGLSNSVSITVSAAQLQRIIIDPINKISGQDSLVQYRASGIYSDLSTQDLTAKVFWSSSDLAVASFLIQHGQAQTGLVGTTEISATLGDIRGASLLTVIEPSLLELRIEPSALELSVGNEKQLKAIALFSNNDQIYSQDVTQSVTWASSQTDVISISNAATHIGLAYAKAEGDSLITANYQGEIASADVVVNAATISSLAIAPKDKTLHPGNQLSFTATAQYSDGSAREVTRSSSWASDNSQAAVINVQGEATALTAGQTNIFVTFDGITATTSLMVEALAMTELEVFPGQDSFPVGTAKQLRARATYADGSTADVTKRVTWISDNSELLHIANSFGSKGLAQALAAGNVSIHITHRNGLSATGEYHISEAELLRLEISPKNASLPEGVLKNYRAMGIYDNGESRELSDRVVWRSGNTHIANINSDGLVLGNTKGSTRIKANFNNIHSSTAVTVSDAVVNGFSLSPYAETLQLGSELKLAAIARFSDGSIQDVSADSSWKSDDPDIIAVTQSGTNIGTIEAVGIGESSVNAHYQPIEGSSWQASSIYNVLGGHPVTIRVEPDRITVPLGASQQFQAFAVYRNGAEQEITHTVTWRTGHPNTASVDAQGLATTHQVGVANISARWNKYDMWGAAALTVSAARVSSIEISPQVSQIDLAQQPQFSVQGILSNQLRVDISQDVVWSSSDSDIASISNQKLNLGRVQVWDLGSINIKASYNDQGNIVQDQLTLQVRPDSLQSIELESDDGALSVGDKREFRAFALYQSGARIEVTDLAIWDSSRANAAINNGDYLQGNATAINSGDTLISATYRGITGTKALTISGF